MRPQSIRYRMALMVLGGVALIWIVAVFGAVHHASRELGEWNDARLVEYAALLARLDAADLGNLARRPLDIRTEQRHAGEPADDDQDGDRLPRELQFEVRESGGKVLASNLPSAASALPVSTVTRDTPVTIRLGDAAWRVATLRDAASGREIRVMESANVHSDLASGIARGIVSPLIIALPILALLIWFAISHSLAPLRTLSIRVGTRDARSLVPLGISTVPAEVRALVESIDHLMTRLRRAIERERAFTADAAHELKTPLAAIKLQAQVALSADTPERQRLAMQRVVQGVDRSARLAEQLLVLARLDEDARPPRLPVDIPLLVEAALGGHRDLAAHRNIELVRTLAPVRSALADPVLVRLMLDNLIDNAIKYGKDGGTIDISLHDDGTKLRLSVSDDGPGVPVETYGRLAERFYRGERAPAPGSGLGLSIVERIAQLIGGSVGFSPGINGLGLAVTIHLPVAPRS